MKDPPILLADEWTSSLDTHTEKQIEELMDDVKIGRTLLVIAHRLNRFFFYFIIL